MTTRFEVDLDNVLSNLNPCEEHDDIQIDEDLDAERSMIPRRSLELHVQATQADTLCTSCGGSMGEQRRYVLEVQSPRIPLQGWDTCSLGCAVGLFKRKFPGRPVGITSAVHVTGSQDLRRYFNSSDDHDFSVVYDR